MLVFFEAPCSLIVYNESISTLIFLLFCIGTRDYFRNFSRRNFCSPPAEDISQVSKPVLWNFWPRTLLHYGPNCLTMLEFSFFIFLIKNILNDVPTGFFTFQNQKLERRCFSFLRGWPFLVSSLLFLKTVFSVSHRTESFETQILVSN